MVHLTNKNKQLRIIMPHSLSKILIHLVFGTKNRKPLINDIIISNLHAYIIGILKNLKCPSIQTNGTSDHIHILFSLGRVIMVSDLVEEVKKTSSKWMKLNGSKDFFWQTGYGAFSISQSHCNRLINYIRNQESHHKRATFQDEHRRILNKYQVEYDERYVWD
jgi:putative transposase